MELFEKALSLFDEANAKDPNGRELGYSRRVSHWVEALVPEASEELRLAARAQHLRRWEVLRTKFPAGTAGYHQWRKAAAEFHAREAGKILSMLRYPAHVVARVQDLIRKKNLGKDKEVQSLEDAACLAFLETHFHEFRKGQDEAKLIDIVRKTWEKMSPKARETAGTLALSSEDRALLTQALSR